VRPDWLADPVAPRDPADDAPGAVPVQPAALPAEEDRPFAALADGEVDRPGGPGRERDRDDLPALAGDGEGPVAAFQAHGLDVGAGSLRHSQPVQREQRDQGVLGR